MEHVQPSYWLMEHVQHIPIGGWPKAGRVLQRECGHRQEDHCHQLQHVPHLQLLPFPPVGGLTIFQIFKKIKKFIFKKLLWAQKSPLLLKGVFSLGVVKFCKFIEHPRECN